MELNFTEIGSNNTKRVSFVYEDENDDNVEDVGTFDDASNFTPGPVQNLKYDNPNVGKFQTINRQKPVIASSNAPTRINAPVDSSMYTQKAPPKPIKKKQISYDDILNSMSMRVGPDGKLQMQSQKLQELQQQQQLEKQQQLLAQQPQRYLPPRHPQQIQQHRPFQQPQQQFYQQQQQQQYVEQPPQQPLTKKQYKQLIVLDLIRRQQEQQRLSQIKSTKLMFPNPNVRISTAPIQGANLNRLFRLK